MLQLRHPHVAPHAERDDKTCTDMFVLLVVRQTRVHFTSSLSV